MLLLVVLIVPMAACNKTQDAEGVVMLKMLEAGYGTRFMDELVSEFKKVEPDITVEVEPVVALNADSVEGELTSRDNPWDLYLTGPMYWRKFIKADGTSDVLYDMTEFFDAEVYGEDVSIRDKMNPDYIMHTEEQGRNWILNWAGGSGGLAVNMTALGDRAVPRTTNEFIETIKDISEEEKAQPDKRKKVYPLIWSGLAWDYWRYVLNCWWAQYDGVDAYNRFWPCLNEDGELSPSVFLQEGILKGLEVLEEILYYEYSYPGSLALAHTDAQAQLMLNKAVFTVTGDWIESEMKNYKNDTIRMMKPPVNSALGEKLGISEAQLIAAVDAVDAGETSAAGLTDEQFLAVKEARSLYFSIGTTHSILIPKSSNVIPQAQRFLQFMLSEKGIEIIYKYAGTLLPFDNTIDTESDYFKSLTPYKQHKFNLEKDIKYIYFDYTSPLRWKAGLQQFYGPSNQPELLFAQQAESQRKSAYDVWMDEYETVNGAWGSYLSAAGLA